jgi:hypothetical protein
LSGARKSILEPVARSTLTVVNDVSSDAPFSLEKGACAFIIRVLAHNWLEGLRP